MKPSFSKNILNDIRNRVLRRKQPISNPRTEKQKAGDAAEQLTAEWLTREKNFRVLDRNWRFRKGELDIIARDRETLVFIEVRARQKGALVSGYHSIQRGKKETLRQCALAYLRKCRPFPNHFRFDIVEVELNNKQIGEMRHFEHVPIFRKHDRPSHS